MAYEEFRWRRYSSLLKQSPVIKGLIGRIKDTERGKTFTARDALIFSILFFISLSLYFEYLRVASFFTDDWTIIGIIQSNNGFHETWSRLISGNPRRPVMWIFYYAVFGLFHQNATIPAFIAIALLWLQASMLYRIMVTLGLSYIFALMVSTILILLPAADSTRLWFSGSTLTLALDFLLISILFGLSGISSVRQSRSIIFWSLSFLFCLLAGLTYEATIPFLALGCCAYFFASGKNMRTAKACVAPLSAAIIVVTYVSSQLRPDVPGYKVPGWAYIYDRIILFANESIQILGEMLPGKATYSGVLILIVSAGFALHPLPLKYRSTKVALVVGWLIFICGYTSFLLAPPQIHPLATGWDNRCNAFSAIGAALILSAIAIALYHLLNDLTIFTGRRQPLIRNCRTTLCLIVTASWFLYLAYENTLNQRNWIVAASESNKVISGFKSSVLPIFKCGRTENVIASNVPAYVSNGIFVFENEVTLTGMLRSISRCATASAVQMDAYRIKRCGVEGVSIVSPSGDIISKYQYGYVIAYSEHERPPAMRVDNFQSCLRAAP
ncbi:hypothetical protein VOI32_05670 [Paraburkholderia caribensis]|uniref:Glycosyltransferase RgtA/B/C/D-like domain-containing protein n=1 Tax=Paraburkholderia caribensis TaxID=75105 RepID=A0ABV0DSJ1_9BURK|nr:hypothetical protein [Paraburkholderia caribensis]MCO4876540.1 hypothetical protein [Paraburkholderia caribensis]